MNCATPARHGRSGRVLGPIDHRNRAVAPAARNGTKARLRSFVLSWQARIASKIVPDETAPSAGDHRTRSGVSSMQKATSNRLSRNVSQPARGARNREAANSIPLNFKVPEEFRREFKTYAAQHNMKLNQVLFDAFVALKEKDAK